MRPSPTLRLPTDRAELYAWHGAALAALAAGRCDNLKELAAKVERHEFPPIVDSAPQCGWFAAKVARFSVLVPARIWLRSVVGEDGQLVEPETLFCEIGGKDYDPAETWPKLCARPISAAEYQHMMALRAWARESAPDQPQAQDGRRVDWNTVRIPPIPAQPVPPVQKRKR